MCICTLSASSALGGKGREVNKKKKMLENNSNERREDQPDGGGNVVFMPFSGDDDNEREMEPIWEEVGNTPVSPSNPTLAPREERTSMCFLLVYLRRLRGAGEKGLPFFTLSIDLIFTFLFSTGIMLILAVVDVYGSEPHGLQAYLPAFAASCALTACFTTTPGAQPQGLFGSHLLAALIGLSFSHATHSLEQPLGHLLASVFAVAFLASACHIFGWFQPSSAATAVSAVFYENGQRKDGGYIFVLFPVLIGVTIIFVLSFLLNNLVPWRPAYPVWW
ncbi:hypothetical protein MOQ_009966 [Trypanosoma cruzi marinkellei]|uniref:HPP transmembrane region domain-containing protein n=1 Tax=Trypanosoma cruzi marinkellei TaxID=85056 RepID=K2MGT5_TRYCR|nr:hypothetical protein MOQ_009966 [Trypanosoma cruzi marinkellei]